MWREGVEEEEEVMEEEVPYSSKGDLYALLHIAPDAPNEDIRKAYRQWAQIYHPDKYQSLEMKNIATENFQRIRDAYEILTDEHKRQIYDIYGMEGLNSGLELGPKLNKLEEIKEELEKLRRHKEEEKQNARIRPTGSLIANLSLPHYLQGDGIIKGMAISSDVQAQVSKRNTVGVGGNLLVIGESGTGTLSMSGRKQLSSVSSIEFMATSGLRSIIGLQTSRQLSVHSTGTSGIMINPTDGSVNLSNTWTRKLSETSSGNIQLVLGADSSIAVGWQKKDDKSSAVGEVKFGTASFGVSCHYTHNFSSKSHGRVVGRIGSRTLEFEVGGGRKISEYSTVRMLYNIGIQGITWRFELNRGGQKLIIPILLSTGFDSLFAAGALMIPSSVYFVLKKFVFKPYYLARDRKKALEKMENSSVQVEEARKSAEKARKLLQNVSDRKKNKQMEIGGLVITKAVYGNSNALKRRNRSEDVNDDVASQVLDVALSLNFLVNDSGTLKLHEGIKKSGIMGFYDPCPGESKLLVINYTFNNQSYEVSVDDLDQLSIPNENHRL